MHLAIDINSSHFDNIVNPNAVKSDGLRHPYVVLEVGVAFRIGKMVEIFFSC